MAFSYRRVPKKTNKPNIPWGLINPTAAAGFQVGPKCQACKKRDGSEGASGGGWEILRAGIKQWGWGRQTCWGGLISKQNGGRENRPDPISWLKTKLVHFFGTLGGTSVCGHPKQFQVCDDSSYLSKTSHQAEIKPFVGSGRMVMPFIIYIYTYKGFHMSLIGSSFFFVYLGLPWSTWIYLKVYVYFPMS